MTTRIWTTNTERTTGLAASLDSIAHGAIVQGSEIENAVNLDTYAAGQVYLSSITPTGSPYVEIHIAYEINGTDYVDAPVAGGTNQDMKIFTLKITTGAGAKRIAIPKFELLPFNFKVSFAQFTNVSLGTGNTVRIWTFNSDFV